MMKLLSLYLLLFSAFSATAQWPGSNIDFGKYNKTFGEDPIKKSPKQRSYYQLNESKPLDLSKARAHHSRVFKGDTTSMSINGYYVEFIPAHVNEEKPDYVYYSSYVTNKDWNLFRRYVVDSIARRILSEEYGLEDWLIPVYDGFGDELPREDWNLNWKNKVDYKHKMGNDMFPYIARMFYPPHESFNWEMRLDERKIMYRYYWVDIPAIKEESKDAKTGQNQAIRSHPERSKFVIQEVCALFRDSTLWVRDSSSLHFGNVADGLVSYYNWHEEFDEMPVTGISQPQARAYLNWLEWNHNTHLKKNKTPYYVEYELPSTDLSFKPQKVEVPSFDLNAWTISNAEYKAFVEYVQDSIALRILGEELGPATYFVPRIDYELIFRDESEWSLDWSAKIDWNRKTGGEKYKNRDGKMVKAPYGVLSQLFYPSYNADSSLVDKRKLIFDYCFYDFKTASIELEREEVDWYEGYERNCVNKHKIQLEGQEGRCYNGNGYFRGKSLDLSYWNARCEAADVFSHEDRSQFIIRDQINVYPGINYRWLNKRCDKNCQWGIVHNQDRICEEYDCEMCPQIEDWENLIVDEYDFDTQPDDLVQGITYYQFRAYWWWYKERRKKTEGNPVIANYIPSKKEFEQLWKGEVVVHPKEVHDLPTPTFNYVIKFYSTRRAKY